MSSKASFLTGSSSACWRSSSLRLLLRTATTATAAMATTRRTEKHPSHTNSLRNGAKETAGTAVSSAPGVPSQSPSEGTPDSVTSRAQPVGVNEKLSNQVPLPARKLPW